MATTLLVTRPRHDFPTRYISAWAEEAIAEARERGCTVLDLVEERAVREQVESMLRKQKPHLVFFNGHGNASCVTGHDNEPLIAADDNDHLLAGAVVYALACQSAKVLGVTSVEHGARAYIGYVEDFIFLWTPAYRTRPAEDRLAALFFTPSNHIVLSLLKGQSVDAAQAKAKREYARTITRLLTSQTRKDDTAAIRFLVWNMRNLVYRGDGDKKIA